MVHHHRKPTSILMGRPRVLPWLLLAAACGLAHNRLQLLPVAEAQQLQPGEFPPATGAMRFLEGHWQGVLRYRADDGSTVSQCVEQIVLRNGTAWQVRTYAGMARGPLSRRTQQPSTAVSLIAQPHAVIMSYRYYPFACFHACCAGVV